MEDIEDKIEVLRHAADLEGCELAEYWYALCDFYEMFASDRCGDKLASTLVEEIDSEYKRLKTEFVIKTVKEEIVIYEKEYLYHISELDD